MSKLFSAKEFIRYLLEGKSKYYIHSPFVFEFVNEVLNDERSFYCYEEIESFRKILCIDDSIIEVEDFGAGSQLEKKNKRTISFIAKTSAAPKKYAQLLFRLIEHYKCKNILELGTSLGVTTLYLSASNHNEKVFSIEGSKGIADEARKNFNQLNRTNINLIQGTFKEKLLSTLTEIKQVDLLYLDGNHRMKPTLEYFTTCLPFLHENSFVVIDDIYWSNEMKQAWTEIKMHPSVTLSIDLFRMGILFFRKDRHKEHFRLYF
ncbi:MAG: class I SAM-dependent methyltransferase [Bacteroidota bacterium]